MQLLGCGCLYIGNHTTRATLTLDIVDDSILSIFPRNLMLGIPGTQTIMQISGSYSDCNVRSVGKSETQHNPKRNDIGV
jgi:hypothetical protein